MTVERSRPSLLTRLAAFVLIALVVAAGVLVFIPIALLGLALVIFFAVYIFLYRLFNRPNSPGGEGRQNVRVIVRDSNAP